MTAPERPEPGLHLVATPIGRARDITLTALDVLAGADMLAAEDTRSLRRLLGIHAIQLGGRALISYHDRNGPAARPRILRALAGGKSVAYASEAGSPLIADPGYRLVQAALEAGHKVHCAPGPSAVITALSVAGLATDRFLFAGFAPAAAGARRRWLAEIAPIPATLVILDSPMRVKQTLSELMNAVGDDREMALCRELTKRHEEVIRGTVAEVCSHVETTPPRGEIVLVIERARRPGPEEEDSAAMDEMLKSAMAELSLSEAVARVAARVALPRRRVYARALELRDAAR